MSALTLFSSSWLSIFSLSSWYCRVRAVTWRPKICLGGQQLVNISLGGGFSELYQRLFCSNHPHPWILFTLISNRVSVIFSRISFHIFIREESQIHFCVFFFTNYDLNYIRTLKAFLIITDYSPAFISRILSTLSSCAALLTFPVMVWRSLFIIWVAEFLAPYSEQK